MTTQHARSCWEALVRCSRRPSTQRQLHCKPRRCRLRWPGCSSARPNILLIPGTSSLEHLRENLLAAQIEIPPAVLADLNSIEAQ